jgi:ribosomal protein S27AE
MAEDGNFKDLPLDAPLEGEDMIYGRDRAIRGQNYVREGGSSSDANPLCPDCGGRHSAHYDCGK